MEICFVCSGNASRSPMAEVIARREMDNIGIEKKIYSCGINAEEGKPVSRRAEIVCNEIGLSLTGMKRKRLNNDIVSRDAIFVVMENGHMIELQEKYKISKDRIFLLGNEIADPRDCDLDVYRSCRDKLIVEIRKVVNVLSIV